jgi:hypothetical protein
MNDTNLTNAPANDQGKTIGNEVDVHFTSIGNKTTKGKVDSGADLSSLHATDITINKERNSVTFNSPALSDNVITMDLAGVQDVHSADGGKTTRPTVKFDIEINGTPIQGTSFNLNDRSNMDSMILVGQNVLKAGNFQIDVNQDSAPERVEQVQQRESFDKGPQIVEALQVLYNNNVTLSEIVEYYSHVTK